jgi:spore maturation protein CgeB
MKILYAAGLSPDHASLYCLRALERLGHTVVPFNAFEYESPNTMVRKVNHDLLNIGEVKRPDGLWADQLLGVQLKVLEKLRDMELHDR